MFHFLFASLWAARTAFPNPPFFHEPFFFWNLPLTLAKAREYALLEALDFRFGLGDGLDSYALRAVFRTSPLVVPSLWRASPHLGQYRGIF